MPCESTRCCCQFILVHYPSCRWSYVSVAGESATYCCRSANRLLMAEVLPVFLWLSASVFLSGHLPAPSVCGAASLAQRLGQDLMTDRNPRDCTGKGAETVASFCVIAYNRNGLRLRSVDSRRRRRRHVRVAGHVTS